MKAVVKRVAGRIVTQDRSSALLLRTVHPEREADDSVYLRFAFITRGTADHIFPSFVMDDWGREIRGLKLYAWVRKNGERFPRGEIFGFEQDGRETQCFLRGLELYARYPTYIYENSYQPVYEGSLLLTILMERESVQVPRPIAKPEDIEQPLRTALLTWWEVPVNMGSQDLDFLRVKPDPGY